MNTPDNANGFPMNEGAATKMTREERLAAKLRENLRRRKAQGKAQARGLDDLDASGATETLPNPHRES